MLGQFLKDLTGFVGSLRHAPTEPARVSHASVKQVREASFAPCQWSSSGTDRMFGKAIADGHNNER